MSPAFAALGHGGQLIVVVPQLDLTVVVMTSRWPMASSKEHCVHMAELLDDLVAVADRN